MAILDGRSPSVVDVLMKDGEEKKDEFDLGVDEAVSVGSSWRGRLEGKLVVGVEMVVASVELVSVTLTSSSKMKENELTRWEGEKNNGTSHCFVWV